MKKILPSFLLLLVILVGCNKGKIYQENLEGVWSVYKYLLYNTDKTDLFKTQHPNYTITFTKDGKFTELITNPDSTYIDGSYSFSDNDEKIVLESAYTTFALDTSGDTVYTNHTLQRTYTIFNLTRDHVQLRNDSSQLYMNKK